MAKHDESHAHSRRQFIKSLVFMAITYLPLSILTYQYILPYAPDFWEGIFSLLTNEPLIAIHFWLTLMIMLFLTVGDFQNHAALLRHRSKRAWLAGEGAAIFFHCILFSLGYIMVMLLINLIVLGLPAAIDLQPEYWDQQYVNFSLWFILGWALLLRIFSALAFAGVFLFFYIKTKSRIVGTLLLSLYGMFSVLALYWGEFTGLVYHKYFLFPAGISHYFFLVGYGDTVALALLHNYLAATAPPLLVTVVFIALLRTGIKKAEVM